MAEVEPKRSTEKQFSRYLLLSEHETRRGMSFSVGNKDKKRGTLDRINVSAYMYLGGASVREIAQWTKLTTVGVRKHLKRVGFDLLANKKSKQKQILSTQAEKRPLARPKSDKKGQIEGQGEIPKQPILPPENEKPLMNQQVTISNPEPSQNFEPVGGILMDDREMQLVEAKLQSQSEKLGRALDNLENRLSNDLKELRRELQEQTIGSTEANRRLENMLDQVTELRGAIPKMPQSFCEEYPALCNTVSDLKDRVSTIAEALPSNLCQVWPDLCQIAETSKKPEGKKREEGHVPASGHKTVKELMDCPECHAKEYVTKNWEKIFGDEPGEAALSEYLRSKGFTVMKQVEPREKPEKKRQMI